MVWIGDKCKELQDSIEGLNAQWALELDKTTSRKDLLQALLDAGPDKIREAWPDWVKIIKRAIVDPTR